VFPGGANCSLGRGARWVWSPASADGCDSSIGGASKPEDDGSDDPEPVSDAGVSEESPPGFVMLINLAYALVPVAGVVAGHHRPRLRVQLVRPREFAAPIEENDD
jgi:hypothetical protein